MPPSRPVRGTRRATPSNNVGTKPMKPCYTGGRNEAGDVISFIGAIIIGGLAGALAKFLMPGRDPGGIILTILLGIAGSVLATWLGQQLGWYRYGEGAGFIGSVIGAIIILVIYRMVARPRPY